MGQYISDAQWAKFETRGYLPLGNVMDSGELAGLQTRIDEIMMGTASIDYRRVMMQLDRDPERDGKPGPQSKGHKLATLSYRKIQNLELEAGESVVLHNWTLHSSGVNETDIARRAFSVCDMDAETHSSRGHSFSRVFGEGALSVAAPQ